MQYLILWDPAASVPIILAHSPKIRKVYNFLANWNHWHRKCEFSVLNDFGKHVFENGLYSLQFHIITTTPNWFWVNMYQYRIYNFCSIISQFILRKMSVRNYFSLSHFITHQIILHCALLIETVVQNWRAAAVVFLSHASQT